MFCGSPPPPVGSAANAPLFVDEDWTARATARLASVGVIPVGRGMPSACGTSAGVIVCCVVAAAVSIVAATSTTMDIGIRAVVTILILGIASSSKWQSWVALQPAPLGK